MRRRTSVIKVILGALFVILLAVQAGPAVRADVGPAPSELRAKRLKVAIRQEPPYSYKLEDGRWQGFNVEVWQEIAFDLKLEYDFVEMDLKDILDALQNNTVDISIAGLNLTPERERLFDFSTPVTDSMLALATQPEKAVHPWRDAMHLIFSWSTLKVLAILLILFAVMGALLWRLERAQNPEHFGEGPVGGIGAGIYWAGSTLASGTCFGVALKTSTARVLGLLWMFACAVVLSAFIASLTSALTIKRLSTPEMGPDDVRGLHLAAVKGGASEMRAKALGAKYTLFDGVEEAISAVNRGQVDGFLYDEPTLRYYEKKIRSDNLAVYPSKFRRTISAFGLPLGSPLRKPVNIALLDLMGQQRWVFLRVFHGIQQTTSATSSPGGQEPVGSQSGWGRSESK